jgi:hypothetical protein
MIAFTVIVGDEFGHRPAKVAFAERDHIVQAFLLDRVVSDNSVDNPPSSRDTVVVIHQPAHTRSAANRPAATGSLERLNQFVADALMVPLTVVVRDELRNRAAKVALTQRDHAVEAFLLDRPNKPLGVRVAVRRAERCLNDPDVLLF